MAILRSPSKFAQLLTPLPAGVSLSSSVRGMAYDVIVAFATTPAATITALLKKDRLSAAGGLWIAWPKKTSTIPHDLDFRTVQQLGLESELVDNKSCGIDDDWQALRFVRRIRDR
ncbi:MAG TPA: DUF3052 domain-containing protein [Chloroflexota bacterium]|nr:DUF3052 domain-containing protein [Chloroflexota bacterium]